MTCESNENTLRGWLAVPLVVAFLCSGCVSSRLAPTVVDYNRAVEQAQNEMLLLNAVRAAKFQPLYLTDTTKINGSIRRDLTATLTLPFGLLHHNPTDPGTTDSAAPGGTYSVNPTFDVNVLNAQEFMQKFTAPMDPQIFAFYWNEGWSQDLLLHLFVDRVEIQLPDGNDEKGNPRFKTTTMYHNHPRVGDPSDLTPDNSGNDLHCYSKWARWFISFKPSLTAQDAEDVKIGPLLGDSKLTFTDLIAGTQTGYTIEEDPKKGTEPGRFQLKRTQKEYRLELEYSLKLDSEHPPDFGVDLADCPLRETKPSGELPGAADASRLGPPARPRGELPDPVDTTVQALILAKPPERKSGAPEEKENILYRAVLHLRSHESLLYYLGQIVRLERNLSDVPLVTIQIGPDPLKKDATPKQDEVSRGPYELVPLFVAFPLSGADQRGDAFPSCPQFAVRVADAEAETYGIPRPLSSAVLLRGDADTRPQCTNPSLCVPKIPKNPKNNEGDLFMGKLSCDAGESMHVLSLLTQLIALEKTAKETTTTPIVRTVGQ